MSIHIMGYMKNIHNFFLPYVIVVVAMFDVFADLLHCVAAILFVASSYYWLVVAILLSLFSRCYCCCVYADLSQSWMQNPQLVVSFFNKIAHEENFHPKREHERWYDIRQDDVLAQRVCIVCIVDVVIIGLL